MAKSFTWEKAREELLYRRNRAMTHGGDRAVEKQRSRGRGAGEGQDRHAGRSGKFP